MKREELINKLLDVKKADGTWMFRHFALSNGTQEFRVKCEDLEEFILSDRARLLADLEEAVRPLREWKAYSERQFWGWGKTKDDKAIEETLSALDKLKEGEK